MKKIVFSVFLSILLVGTSFGFEEELYSETDDEVILVPDAYAEQFERAQDDHDFDAMLRLCVAVENGDLDVNAVDDRGDTLLHAAATWADLDEEWTDIAEWLIQRGANVNQRNGSFGEAPLHFAPTVRMANLLLDNGADPNLQNLYRDTPLHRLLGDDNFDVFRVVASRGGNPDFENETGVTVWDCAQEAGRPEYINVLIEVAQDMEEGDPQAPTQAEMDV